MSNVYVVARTLVGMTVRDLAELADVSTNTIQRLETLGDELKPSTLEKIKEALESFGCEFYDDPVVGEWVRPNYNSRRWAYERGKPSEWPEEWKEILKSERISRKDKSYE